MSSIISVSNHKGGVGKTTVSANLAFTLARKLKVLIIDFDPQANLTEGMGYSKTKKGICEYLKEKIHFRTPNITPISINNYVHLIPTSLKLAHIEKLLKEMPNGECVLNELLVPIRSKYDVIIIDCPTSINLLSVNAFNCSNLILIPCKAEKFAVDGIETIESLAANINTGVKILFNEIDARLLLHKQTIRETCQKFAGKVLDTKIRKTISLAEAFSHAKNIFDYKPESKAINDFIDLSDELIQYI